MSNDVVLEKLYKAGSDYFRIQIHQDPDCESPREWTNAGILVTWESKYGSPDGRHRLPAYLERAVAKWCFDGGTWTRPVNAAAFVRYCRAYLPDRVLAAASLSRSAGDEGLMLDWDPEPGAWHDGIALITRESWADVMGDGPLDDSAGDMEAVGRSESGLMAAELATYNCWQRGDVYGFVVERAVTGGWEEIPDGSCWGSISDDPGKYPFSEAKRLLPDGAEEIDALPETRSSLNPEDETPAQAYTREVKLVLLGFESELCSDCGLDIEDHVISADPLGHPHAWCRYPSEQDKQAQDVTIAELQKLATRLTDPDAISGLSSDDEIVELRLALSVALSRWPEVQQ